MYFRNHAFVTWRSRGIWTIWFRTSTSYVFPIYLRVFLTYFRRGLICFRGFDFVLVPDLPSCVSDLLSRPTLLPRLWLRAFSLVHGGPSISRFCLNARSSLILERFLGNRTIARDQFLRNRTIAHNQNTVKPILFLVHLWFTSLYDSTSISGLLTECLGMFSSSVGLRLTWVSALLVCSFHSCVRSAFNSFCKDLIVFSLGFWKLW